MIFVDKYIGTESNWFVTVSFLVMRPSDQKSISWGLYLYILFCGT